MKIYVYTCPNCAGAVKFDISTQIAKCPFCGTGFDPEDVEEECTEIEEGNFDWGAAGDGRTWDAADRSDLCAGSCPSCGAEFFGNENTVATVCPCCGNAQIIIKRLSGDLKPDYVIPFQLEKKAAVAALEKFCKGKRLLPDRFAQKNHLEEIQGLYVPFWLFDANARGRMRYEMAKGLRRVALRDGSLAFEKVPVKASQKMNEAFMDALEPYDYAQIRDFNKSYLAGYVAEKYDTDAAKCKWRAEWRIVTTLEKEFLKTVGGSKSVKQSDADVDVKDGRVSYGLFPVWVLNTKYQGKNHQFMMNGQTGRLAGKLPVDDGKAWRYRLAFTAVFGAVLTVLTLALYAAGAVEVLHSLSRSLPVPLPEPSLTSILMIVWLSAAAGGLLTVQPWVSKMNTVREKHYASDYTVPGSLKFRVKSG